MKIGYARVSTPEQNLQTQIDALLKAGCEKIYSEKASAAGKRPELEALLSHLRSGDQLVITKLDRLGRSVKHLTELSCHFEKENIQLISLHDAIDTSNAIGRMVFHLLASIAEFERELVSERTKAALAIAAQKGRKGGKPPIDPKKLKRARDLYEQGVFSVTEICRVADISRGSFYKHIAGNPQLKIVK